jgi:hypothetical protein
MVGSTCIVITLTNVFEICSWISCLHEGIWLYHIGALQDDTTKDLEQKINAYTFCNQ